MLIKISLNTRNILSEPEPSFQDWKLSDKTQWADTEDEVKCDIKKKTLIFFDFGFNCLF